MHLMGDGGELGLPSEFKALLLLKPSDGSLYL